MDEQRKERRGDRRRAAAWVCPSNVVRVRMARLEDFPRERDYCRGEPDELPDGRIVCDTCGTVDVRGTEGNRRQARDELAALQRRIERELHGFGERLEALHGQVGRLGDAADADIGALRDESLVAFDGVGKDLARVRDRLDVLERNR